jgi:hypothetical protein
MADLRKANIRKERRRAVRSASRVLEQELRLIAARQLRRWSEVVRQPDLQEASYYTALEQRFEERDEKKKRKQQ